MPRSEFPIVPSYPRICNTLVGVPHRPLLPSYMKCSSRSAPLSLRALIYAGPWSEVPIVPSYPHYPHATPPSHRPPSQESFASDIHCYLSVQRFHFCFETFHSGPLSRWAALLKRTDPLALSDGICSFLGDWRNALTLRWLMECGHL